MLSAPVKSAKRISSLFSLSSHKEQNANGPPAPSPGLNSPSDFSQERRRRSSSRPTRHVSTPNALSSSEPRTVPHPEPFDLPPPPSLLAVNHDLAASAPSSPIDRPGSRGRDVSLSRPSSSAGLAIPGSAPDSRPSTPSKRRSWMPGMGARSRAGSMDRRVPPPMLPGAWIAGLDQKVVYDMGPLSRGEQVSELWNEQGDTYVYLFPQNTGRPASFKVDSTIFAESPSLNHLCRGADSKSNGLEQPTRSLSLGNPISPPLDTAGPDEDQELHLYLPIPLNSDVSNLSCRLTQEDTETLLLFRNLFAFLLGQSLIASPKSATLFSIFMDVAVLLARFEFSNLDGSNFGETATSSFSNYCDELRLADVRKSREKTIEAIVLGERLRYYPLYVEGFVHGVGKLDEIKQLRSPKFTFIHPITQKRLERGFIDLDSRLRGLYGKLEDFDFPSVFSGIANSTTSAESKVVRFKTWKSAFLEFRRFTMSFYRTKYGSWPPKARSKKNEFEESGLNRQLLLDLYRDFCDLYDMLVDRTDLTTRTIDLSGAGGDAKSTDHKDVTVRAVRQVLSEYDRSTPPVLPPIPFDIPQMPNLQPLHRKPLDAKKEAKQRGKKLKSSDTNAVLMGSYTRESIRSTQFIEEFMKFERRCAHGKTVDDLVDMRCGQWIFLYSVIQSMPMLTVDVPEVQFNQGVEYFLCIAPRGGAPWIQNDTKTARSWFGVAGGAGVVSLPSDVVINGVEGVYRRSHCWQLAEQWAEAGALLPPPNVEDAYEENESSISSPYPAQQSSAGSSSDPQPGSALGVHGGLTPPPPAIPRTRSPGAANRAEHRHSIYPGLEALPLPAGIAPIEPPARPISRFNPNMSFDDILREVPDKNKKKR
ncbi:hypothetical protein N7509_006971 [Penicillium cosmopolitanum]|uniref:DUF8004 domain-containing protein n=1 Tax=Penicillium cosmopolitanum TaxID=1131564 RepID=A0A9W9VY97_9EURO|nr:uncharacterized protein N7509_006971 [Penicillium cosmopolitanum]KAJ5391481.1 hypothetical protein N7509_006971 [Penicillium cosmopolitanum]